METKEGTTETKEGTTGTTETKEEIMETKKNKESSSDNTLIIGLLIIVILLSTGAVTNQIKKVTTAIYTINENFNKTNEIVGKIEKSQANVQTQTPQWKVVSEDGHLYFRRNTDNRIAETVEVWFTKDEVTYVYHKILKRDVCYYNTETYRLSKNEKRNIDTECYNGFPDKNGIKATIYRKISDITKDINDVETIKQITKIEKILAQWKD